MRGIAHETDIQYFMMERFINDGFSAVVDSGVGGLTVLRQLQKDYPQCNFAYIADSAYCPYGVKGDDLIRARVFAIADWAAARGAKAVVLACNTASVFADELRKRVDIPVYDVISQTCLVAASTTQNKRVALLATDATVRSEIYRNRLARYGVRTHSFACSAFVPFAEKGETDSPECVAAIRSALQLLPQADADTVVLGCTHFPLLRKTIEMFTGGARIVECATDFSPPKTDGEGRGATKFFTTGNDSMQNARGFYPKARFVHVDI